MSIKFNHRLGTIDVDTSTYDTTSVTSNTDYTITVSVSDAAVVANANSTVDFYYNGTITARAGGIGGIGCFEITEGDVAGDAGARILYFIDSANAIKASINSGTNSGDFVIDNNIANKDINLTPSGTGNVALGNFVFDADQTVGAGQDNYVFTYDNATGLISLEAATGGGLSGTVANDQVVVGTGASTVDSSSGLTFDGSTLTTTAAIVATDAANAIEMESASPKIRWHETDATANTGEWDMLASGDTFLWRTRADGDLAGETIMSVTRSGATVGTIDFPSGGQIDIYQAQYVDLDSATTTCGIRLRTDAPTSTQRGYLYADANQIGILNDAGGDSIRHNHSDDSVTIAGVLYPNNQTVGNISAVTGNYGSIQVDGHDGSGGETTWGGLSIGGELVFLAQTTGVGTTMRGGIYDDINTAWPIQYNTSQANREIALEYAGADKLTTTSTGIDITGGITLDTDITWSNASQPWVTLDSNGGGADPWDNQGAGISVGESGKKGSAAIHITYQGAGVGRFGMGTVDDTTGSGGAPAYGHFRMVYNNYNVQAAGRLFPGTNSNTVQSTKAIEATTGYGSINVIGGGTSSYLGYSINNDINFMSNGTTHGLYNAGSSEWIISTTDNSFTYLYYNGTGGIRTVSGSSDGYSTHGQVLHNRGTYYDIGLNEMPQTHANASITLDHSDCGGYYYHSNAVVYTITLNNTAAQGASFPTDGVFFVINNGSVGITVSASGVTLYNPHLGTTGNRTIAANSVATILKYSSASWFVWGTDVT